jgi:hypothetical protein
VRRRRRMYERSRSRARREVNWSEEEEIEADISSTDSSMRVYILSSPYNQVKGQHR